MPTRRRFLQGSALGLTGALLPRTPLYAAVDAFPRITFYGSTRQVSGSCHLLETSQGLYLIDCGLFISDVPDPDAANKEFPFDVKDVKGVFLTHAHTDHNGRLPYLHKLGYRGPIYCTDATRDLSQVMLRLSADLGESRESPLYSSKDAEGALSLLKAVPYAKKFDVDQLVVRYTDAGHILGSAMVEIWADRRKLLFTGDMGPDTTPILCSPTQHYGADAVLVESTYGASPRDLIDYQEFGKRIAAVVKGGGSVLLPAFALHKTQLLIHLLHKLAAEDLLPRDVPIISDSGTAKQCTRLYDAYPEYWDADTKAYARGKSLFYRERYREMRISDSLETHAGGPAIYISTSGMLDHAASPKHLYEMARDPRNAVFVVGYQLPESIGSKLLMGDERLSVPWEDFREGRFVTEMRETEVRLQVETLSGFSSHARGQQILEWAHKFESIGPVYVVHGDESRSVALSEKMTEMQVPSQAPRAGESFVVTGERVTPGDVPTLAPNPAPTPAPVDQ